MILNDSLLLRAILLDIDEIRRKHPPARPMCLSCSEYVDDCECAEHVDCECCDDPEKP